MRRRNSRSFDTDRAREAAQRRWHPTPPVSPSAGAGHPTPGTRDARPPQREAPELSGSDSFSARERLRWEAEHSPSATARVSAAKRLLDDEPRSEPEPEPAVVPRRGLSLLDILAVAAACGMDLDALVAAAKVRVPAVESSLARAHSRTCPEGRPRSVPR
jgi:hypothetical protein